MPGLPSRRRDGRLCTRPSQFCVYRRLSSAGDHQHETGSLRERRFRDRFPAWLAAPLAILVILGGRLDYCSGLGRCYTDAREERAWPTVQGVVTAVCKVAVLVDLRS